MIVVQSRDLDDPQAVRQHLRKHFAGDGTR